MMTRKRTRKAISAGILALKGTRRISKHLVEDLRTRRRYIGCLEGPNVWGRNMDERLLS